MQLDLFPYRQVVGRLWQRLQAAFLNLLEPHQGFFLDRAVDALPGVTLKGKVTSVTPRSAVKRGDVTYTVKVAIANPDPRLKWGMTAFVDIQGK